MPALLEEPLCLGCLLQRQHAIHDRFDNSVRQ